MVLFKVAELLGQPVWFLRATMPKDELYKWLSYLENKAPTIQEQQMAVLSTIVSNALGGKAKVKDFLISKTSKQKPKTMSLDDMRGLFGVQK